MQYSPVAIRDTRNVPTPFIWSILKPSVCNSKQNSCGECQTAKKRNRWYDDGRLELKCKHKLTMDFYTKWFWVQKCFRFERSIHPPIMISLCWPPRWKKKKRYWQNVMAAVKPIDVFFFKSKTNRLHGSKETDHH